MSISTGARERKRALAYMDLFGCEERGVARCVCVFYIYRTHNEEAINKRSAFSQVKLVILCTYVHIGSKARERAYRGGR